MARKIHEHDGWKAIWTDSGKYGLSYDSNILGDQVDGGLIEIDEEVFNAASKPDVTLKELFDNFNLEKNKVFYKTRKPIYAAKKESTSTKYYGRGLIAMDEDGRYFMQYQKAAHGGGSRKIEVSKEIYEDIRLNDLGATDVILKYNLQHLDIPENDVK